MTSTLPRPEAADSEPDAVRINALLAQLRLARGAVDPRPLATVFALSLPLFLIASQKAS